MLTFVETDAVFDDSAGRFLNSLESFSAPTLPTFALFETFSILKIDEKNAFDKKTSWRQLFFLAQSILLAFYQQVEYIKIYVYYRYFEVKQNVPKENTTFNVN